MRKLWCPRPETTHADFGTSNGPLRRWFPCPPLCQRGGLRASSSRPFDTISFFRQDTTFGVTHWITDVRPGLTLDGRLASGREASLRVNWALCIDLCQRGSLLFCPCYDYSPTEFPRLPWGQRRYRKQFSAQNLNHKK